MQIRGQVLYLPDSVRGLSLGRLAGKSEIEFN